MLKEIHFLLTYACNYECDHCFLYCTPWTKGTFTLAQIKETLAQASEAGSVERVYFEGGEPLLFFPLLLAAVKAARDKGFFVGIVSNGYMSTSVEDAGLWLKPLLDAGVGYMSLSDDDFHSEGDDNPGSRALEAARNLDAASDSICINRPQVMKPGEGQEKGRPVIGGGAMFRGRAADKLTDGLPRRDWQSFTTCPHEELVEPTRVHVDSFGNVHICQGLSMGNMFQASLSKLDKAYRAADHPICGPLVKGGPAQLVREYDLAHEDGYVDECHLCYTARKALLDEFPQYLAPRQVYGLE